MPSDQERDISNRNGFKWFMLTILVLFLLQFSMCAITVSQVRADDTPHHNHGVDGLPDWYDQECCNTTDCRPVKEEDLEETAPGVWKHIPTGSVFQGTQVRSSKDSRYHVCIMPSSGRALCIYIVQGA